MIECIPGRKAPEDKIIKINGHALTFKELAEIIVQYIKNEDVIYPKSQGFRGGDMLKDFLNEAMDAREVSPELLKRYFL